MCEMLPTSGWAERSEHPNRGGVNLKRNIVRYSLALVIAGTVGFVIFLYVVLAPFAERRRHAERAFGPLKDLSPLILDNAFGVYMVEFSPSSQLTDDNASRLLQLNELPAKYELTLTLSTMRITDASIPRLSELKSVDQLVVVDSGITDTGIADLEAALPGTYVTLRIGD